MAVYKPMRKTENGLEEVKLPYSVLHDTPIIKTDLSTLTAPVANTYYLHTGASGNYDQGKIYFYSSTGFRAIDGGNGDGSSGKEYIKNFTIADFEQVGDLQKYCLQITKKEHGLTNPFCDGVMIDKSDNGETVKYITSVLFGSRLLKSTGTIKIYLTIDLSKYIEYSGKIYLKGE